MSGMTCRRARIQESWLLAPSAFDSHKHFAPGGARDDVCHFEPQGQGLIPQPQRSLVRKVGGVDQRRLAAGQHVQAVSLVCTEGDDGAGE